LVLINVKHSVKLPGYLSIATGYGLGGRSSIPCRGKRFFSAPQRPDRFWAHSGALFPGIKRLERETDHSPPFMAEVKNDGAIPPPPCTCMSSWHSV
jgi:hypothetical protein